MVTSYYRSRMENFSNDILMTQKFQNTRTQEQRNSTIEELKKSKI